MSLTTDEIEQIATKAADEVITRIRQQDQDRYVRDAIIGSMVGEGAIPLRGRETRKAPCHGCRIDPDKPLEAGNVMATTEDAIGTLSAREVRDWCSEITEDKDGRCVRVRGIREAAKKCREEFPSDTRKFFQCFAPAWGAGEHQSGEKTPTMKKGDRVTAKNIPIPGTVVAKGVSPYAVQVRWDDGELGWCDVRDLKLLPG